jgi:nucleotide-binding universal stress UspA family protein
MYQKILVPVDQSRFSENAIAYAAALARETHGTVHICLVHTGLAGAIRTGSPLVVEATLDAEIEHDERHYLEQLAARTKAEYLIEATWQLLRGPIARAIEAYVVEQDIDLMVMSTHGRGGLRRAWLGSVADRLVRNLPVPLLLVRPIVDLPRTPPFHSVVAGLDGSVIAESALRAAQPMIALDAQLTLTRVVVPPLIATNGYFPQTVRLSRIELTRERAEADVYTNALAERLTTAGWKARANVVLSLQPADAILETANSVKADVIVVGTHGRNPVSRAFIGSVADKVIRGTDVPVFVFPAHALATQIERAFEPAQEAKV